MQPETNQPEGHLAPLKKVTPLSKYLAMILFIIMPFVGGWIGYQFAPEKIVEVERFVEVEKKVDSNVRISGVDALITGITLPNKWTLESSKDSSPSHEIYEIKDESGQVIISISHAENLVSYSMAAPIENRSSLKEALGYELKNIEETQVGGLLAYSGDFVNETTSFEDKEVWVDKDGEIYVFSFDPEKEDIVSEILKNIKW